MTAELVERSAPGLHARVASVIGLDGLGGGRAMDLGAGSGAWARRLIAAGFEVVAVDLDAEQFQVPGVRHVTADLSDQNDLTRLRTLGRFDLVTALEVIEHVENPIALLRLFHDVVTPDGLIVVTTPNVDSLPARIKFLLRGRLRMMDEWGDTTHITPIFWDLLIRQYLPAAGLRIKLAAVHPERGVVSGRAAYRPVLRALGPLQRRNPRLLGDNHILLLQRMP